MVIESHPQQAPLAHRRISPRWQPGAAGARRETIKALAESCPLLLSAVDSALDPIKAEQMRLEEIQSRAVKGEHNMQIEKAKFRLSGDPAKIERFFIELAELGIPFEANDTFTIAQKDSPFVGALASVLSITLYAPA